VNRVTLADGSPAYERAPQRLRQSQIDLSRGYADEARRRTLSQDLGQLSADARDLGEPGAATGTLIVCCGISSLFVMLVAAFAILS
jgi:hypothetical protein